MKFILNGYEKLKFEFDNVIEGYTGKKRDSEKTEKFILGVADEGKRSHLLLAHIIFEHFSKKPADASPALFGAMLVANAHNRNTLYMVQKEKNSYIMAGFKTCMGIDEKKKIEPSTEQYAQCYREFNNLLKSLIYVDGNSLKGLKTEHPFTKIPGQILGQFLELGFALEAKYNNALLASLPEKSKNPGKSKVIIADYRPSTVIDITPSVVDSFKKFDALSDALRSLINRESKAHHSPDLANVVEKRKLQILTMKNVADALKETKLTDIEKTSILAGTMYLVRENISSEYTKTPFSKEKNGSVTHTELSKILGLSNEPETEGGTPKAMPSLENIEVMIRSALHFMEYMAIEPASEKPAAPVAAPPVKPAAAEIKKDKKAAAKAEKSTEKTAPKVPVAEEPKEPTRLFREKTIFPDGFNFLKIAELGQNLIFTCRNEALNNCVKKIADSKPKEPKAAAGGITSYITYYCTFKKPTSSASQVLAADEEALTTPAVP